MIGPSPRATRTDTLFPYPTLFRSAKTRNLRLTALRAFFRFLAFEEPASSGQIQRILAIPGKLTEKREVDFLSRPEIDAVLAAPDRTCWLGRRDHMLLLLRSEERRVGKEGVSTCRFRCSPYP